MKITMSSTDPNYRTFDEWFDQKINDFIAGGNEATADAWIAAMRAKTAAEEASDSTVTKVDANSVIISKPVVVDEFDAVFNQWVAQYNIQFAYEEV